MSRARLSFFAALALLFALPAIAQAPYGFRHLAAATAGSHVLYDTFHQRFYATVPGENAVYVIAESDGSLLQKINVPSAYGLDLSIDGKMLYVSSNVTILGYAAAQTIAVVDTTTLHVVNILRPTASSTLTGNAFVVDNMPGFLAALSDGKLAYTATPVGITGGAVYSLDTNSGISTPIEPQGYYAGELYKASSGNGFVVVSSDSAGEEVNVFDTSSSTYISNVYFNTTNNEDVAVSPDGSLVLLGGHILCNRALQKIADLAVAGQPTSFAWTSQGSRFSPDGSKIYVASTLSATSSLPGGGTSSYANPVLYIFSSSSHQLLATVPLPEGSSAFESGYSGIAVGNSGKALLVDNTGFLELDPSTAPATLVGTYAQGLDSTPVTSPDGGTPNAPQSTTVNGSGFRNGAQVYFGQTPVSTTYVSANVLNVQPPSGPAGLVDVSISFPDGWALLAPQAYSYGPVIQLLTATAGSTNGGTSVTAYGSGFDVASGYPTVLVGGRTATVTAATKTYVTFTTPSGSVGAADVQLTSMFGTTTLSGGFIYVSQQLIPSLAALQMIFDNARNQIYVADGNSGNVYEVSAATLAANVLFKPVSGGASALAMTPDGSELLVANAAAGTLDVINLSTGKDIKTIVPTPGNITGTYYPAYLVATARGTALVGLVGIDLYDAGEVTEVNLSSGTVTLLLGNLTAGIDLAASADGSLVYIAQSSADGSSGGAPMLWTSAEDAITKYSVVGGYGPADLSTTDLGDRVLEGCYTQDQADTWLRLVTACAPDPQRKQSRQSVLGSKIHSSGSLGYLPTTKGVEIFDIHHGQTLMSVGNVYTSLEGPANLAVTHDGSQMYVAQTNGIGVFTLPSVPLSIGSLTPSSGSEAGGQAVVLRGSGFVQGASVTVDGKPAGVQFVDSTQLLLTMPSVTPAEDIVAVTNPDGTTYSLDAAWNANIAAISTPVLTSISPVLVYTNETTTFTINGSGFVPDSVALLNGSVGNTHFVNTTQLTVTFANLPGPGTESVTVINGPGGAASNALSIKTSNEAPYLNSFTPTSIPAGSESFQLEVFCNVALTPGSVVLWNGAPLISQLIDPSDIVAQVPAALVASAGTATLAVYTPQANPSTSNSQTFTITPSVAAMSLSASSITMGPLIEGTTAAATFTVTSTGPLPLVMTGIASSDATFKVSGCTTTLAQGQSCTATVVYAPTNRSGLQGEQTSITIASNATSQPKLLIEGFSGYLSITENPTSLGVTAGQTANVAVSAISYGYIPTFTAQLSCSGLPANATCTFNPSTFAMSQTSFGYNSTANFTVSIATQPHTTGYVRDLRFVPGIAAMASLLALIKLPRRRRFVPLACLCLSLIALSGCGGGGSGANGGGGTTGTNPASGTPAGAYTVTVTGTLSGTAVVTQTFALNVF